MPDETMTDKLDDLVAVLDSILKEISRIAASAEMLEFALGPTGLFGSTDNYLQIRIVNPDDDPVWVEIVPLEDE